MMTTAFVFAYLCGAILALKHAELLRMASILLHDKRGLEGEAWAQIKAEAQVETEDYRTLNEMNNC